MAVSSFISSSLCGIRQYFKIAAVIGCVLFCLPMTTTALPMKDVVGQAMMTAKMEQQQQQQQEHHRQKRAVTKTHCAQPDNLDAMFQQINSELSSMQFLNNLYDGKAISIPASEVPEEVEIEGVNKTCPSSLNTQPGAPLEQRSLCPYYFNLLQLPEGYYPNSLPTARCKCQRCVQNGALGCEAVSTRIAVLKPVGCFQGLQKYEEEHIHVNTACTCASGGSTQTTTSAPTTTTTLSWGVE